MVNSKEFEAAKSTQMDLRDSIDLNSVTQMSLYNPGKPNILVM